MPRPRLLLIPEFTELAWGSIRSDLSEWAEVAAYDPPGVGDEPIADEDVERVRRGERSIHDLFARRGLEEVDRRGWDRFFVVADAWGNAPAARIAVERPGAVLGIALGHASLSFDMDSERPAVSREVWAAMGQLLRQDHREFIRHGIVQMTRGSVSDEAAAEMIDRFPGSALRRGRMGSAGPRARAARRDAEGLRRPPGVRPARRLHQLHRGGVP